MRDFKQLADGDIDLSGDDFVFVESTQQNLKDIVAARKGEMKHAPDRGVGIEDFLNDESPEDLLREIRRQINKDGARIVRLTIIGGNTQISATYE